MKSNFIPQFPTMGVPQQEHEGCFHFTDALGSMNTYIQNFEHALRLYEFSKREFDRFYEKRKTVPRCGEESTQIEKTLNMISSWKFIAAKDGAMNVYHFGKTIESARGILFARCPTWAAVTSREDIKKAFSHFEKEFPRRDAIRHTVAHEAEFRRPADLPDHVITGEMENVFVKSSGKVSLYVSGGLVGDTFTTTFEGQLLEYEVSEATLSKLKQARLHFWDALDGIDNFIREQMFGPKPSPEAT